MTPAPVLTDDDIQRAAESSDAKTGPARNYKGERLVTSGRCYCGKKARRVTEYAGRHLPVCSAWCAGRLPSKVAEMRGRT